MRVNLVVKVRLCGCQSDICRLGVTVKVTIIGYVSVKVTFVSYVSVVKVIFVGYIAVKVTFLGYLFSK